MYHMTVEEVEVYKQNVGYSLEQENNCFLARTGADLKEDRTDL